MRVVVVGTSGSGKSTIGEALSAALRIPFVEIDAINWQANWRDLQTDDPAEFKRRVAAATQGDAWIVAGNYSVVQPLFWPRATHVVWLDYPRGVVMRRVIWRSLVRALDRHELWPGTGNRERFWHWLDADHPIRWAWKTHARNRARYAAMAADPANAHIAFLRLADPREAAAAVARLAREKG
ncbi:MAG TPA: shikimate kinase [Rhizomicrobium sp.]